MGFEELKGLPNSTFQLSRGFSFHSKISKQISNLLAIFQFSFVHQSFFLCSPLTTIEIQFCFCWSQKTKFALKMQPYWWPVFLHFPFSFCTSHCLQQFVRDSVCQKNTTIYCRWFSYVFLQLFHQPSFVVSYKVCQTNGRDIQSFLQ